MLSEGHWRAYPACMSQDAEERAAFLRNVRQALQLIEEEMSRKRTRANEQVKPNVAELRDVERNLADILERPYRLTAASADRMWDGRAARLVKDWPGEDPVRHAVTQLWNQYTRRL